MFLFLFLFFLLCICRLSLFAGRSYHLEKYSRQQNQIMNIENGNHDVTNRSSITNGKFINNWRIQRCTDDNDNDVDDGGDGNNGSDTDASKLHYHTNGNGMNGGYTMENGGHRSYFKRSSHSDNNNKYPLRMNGLRKSSAYFQENGTATRSEFHDIYENSAQHSQFR